MWDSRAEADRWLRQAENDLAHARHSARGCYFSQTCFVAQQVAEKAVKAMAYSLGDRTVLGHSVAALIDRYAERAPGLEKLRNAGALLDLYYIPTRYPNGLPGGYPFRSFTEEQAARAIEEAERFVAFANEVVNKD